MFQLNYFSKLSSTITANPQNVNIWSCSGELEAVWTHTHTHTLATVWDIQLQWREPQAEDRTSYPSASALLCWTAHSLCCVYLCVLMCVHLWLLIAACLQLLRAATDDQTRAAFLPLNLTTSLYSSHLLWLSVWLPVFVCEPWRVWSKPGGWRPSRRACGGSVTPGFKWPLWES